MAIDYTKRPQRAPEPPAPPVSLQKITLTKSSAVAPLASSTEAGGILAVNLSWTTQQFAVAFPEPPIDLDLGCLYQLNDGSAGVVQSLGNSFTSVSRQPGAAHIWLDGDDRKGSGGENLYVDLSRSTDIRRILIFASIYEGAANWVGANGVVTLTPLSGPQIEVRLNHENPHSRICAIAQIYHADGEIRVQREVHYINGGQIELDHAYNWGLTWSYGRK